MAIRRVVADHIEVDRRGDFVWLVLPDMKGRPEAVMLAAEEWADLCEIIKRMVKIDYVTGELL